MQQKAFGYRNRLATLVFMLSLCCGPSANIYASEFSEADAIANEARSWCSAGSSIPSYDAYPGTAPYLERAASPAEWTETFNEYADNETVECASGKSLRAHLDVTSQCLRKKTISDGSTGYSASVEHALLDLPRGEEYRKIRALAFSLDPQGNRVLWTNQEHRLRLFLSSLDKKEPLKDCNPEDPDDTEKAEECVSGNQGMSMFARYRTENDHYVASLKTDGYMFIKQKFCNKYIPLEEGWFESPVSTRNWYNLVFRAEDVKHPETGAPGVKLTFTVTRPSDGYRKTLTKTHYESSRFPNGTGGFRTDYIRGYVEDWRVGF
jgi:hypothetical protein